MESATVLASTIYGITLAFPVLGPTRLQDGYIRGHHSNIQMPVSCIHKPLSVVKIISFKVSNILWFALLTYSLQHHGWNSDRHSEAHCVHTKHGN